MSHHRLRAAEPAGLVVELMYDAWIAVVEAAGEVDMTSVGRLRAVIDEAVATGHDLLIDLCDCDFIDSSGVGQLLRAQRLAESQEASFAVACRPDGIPARVLQIVTADLFPVHPSRLAALTAMGGGRGRHVAEAEAEQQIAG